MAATSMFCNQCAHKIFPPGKSERTVEGRRECSFWEKRERESPAGFQFGKSTWRWRDQSGRHSGVLHGGWRHLPRITPACYMIAGCVWPTWLNGTELEKKKRKRIGDLLKEPIRHRCGTERKASRQRMGSFR